MVYSVDVYDIKGKVVSHMQMSEDKFSDAQVQPSLIHEYLLLQRANARLNIAHTKNRGEVAGSGKKIYKQKGTGGARAGDRYSPIRKGWGVAFGPRNERNYVKTMNKKAKKKALYGILTTKLQNKEILWLTGFDYQEPKTKNAFSVLKNIGIAGKKVLVVIDQKNAVLEKSFRNMENVKYLLVEYLNPFDLMYYDVVLCLQPALEKINQG